MSYRRTRKPCNADNIIIINSGEDMTPEQIRDALSGLQGDARLDASVLKGTITGPDTTRSANNVNVAIGDQFIPFSTPFAPGIAGNYTLDIIDTDGLGVTRLSKNYNGFTVNSLSAGTIDYTATINI